MTNKCSERVFSNDRADFGGHMCRNKASVLRDGKWYCKIHDPEYVNKKRAEQSRIWNERDEAQRRLRRLEYAAPDMLEALKDLAKYIQFNKGNAAPIYEKAMEAINKAEGK